MQMSDCKYEQIFHLAVDEAILNDIRPPIIVSECQDLPGYLAVPFTL